MLLFQFHQVHNGRFGQRKRLLVIGDKLPLAGLVRQAFVQLIVKRLLGALGYKSKGNILISNELREKESEFSETIFVRPYQGSYPNISS